jgi:hypothetical protein
MSFQCGRTKFLVPITVVSLLSAIGTTASAQSNRATVGVFAARTQASQSTTAGLTGTSWQLVKIQSGDGTTLTPDDRSKYTIEFGALALTRAKCAAGSLHDQIVKQWSFIRSFVTKDGHLFLALMADGGTYEFEPLTKNP